MAGRTDADYGLVPVKSRVSLSSRPVPPFYNKGNESNLSKQDLSYLFLRHCKLRVISVFALPTVFFSNTDYKDFHGYYCFEKNYPFNPSNPCSKHSPVNVKKDRQKKYQPCFGLFLTVISIFPALFSKKYFLLNVIPPFHLTPIIILIISGLYMVELWWK